MRKQVGYCKKCHPKTKEGGKDIPGIVLYRNAACELSSKNDARCQLGFDKKNG